ncbi:MAG TPA: dTMP kinase [Allosphingosinicella sp.]|nr:dTMP kinase [Allosphingosinicella sp.]
MAGTFISLEGGEGVGKSTQLKALADALHACGLEILTTREPGGSPGAEAIRGLLLHDHHWTPEAEALLFAAARADHVATTIRPALAEGKWVITDRFVDSSIAYQGGAAGLGFERVRALHDFGSHGFLPDRTLLLQLPEAEAEARARGRDTQGADLIGGRDAGFHRGVAEAFARLAAEEPDRFRVIDASGEATTVTNRLLAAVEDLLP